MLQRQNLSISQTRAGWAIGVLSLFIILLVAILLLSPRGVFASEIDVSVLPLVNACLNSASGLLLVAGYFFIRRRQIKHHLFCMSSAFGLSVLFLILYVTYHAIAGSTHFMGQGWIRPIYFTILISHIILAAFVVPLALTTLYRVWQGTFNQHKRIARLTLPVWLYVSVSGVAIYLMLYHIAN